ncbi:transcriptional regulator [Levilactobacillus koreensis JCM 16448]|uniref:Transcriptional regulator n=1 Tax=Levilactobacillus koreensis TaxID=637971 RepID=A0AAC8ZGF0_9LACO|nr:MarR family transcriptional regulator [Levilactobacillus koreensis]AKP64215.1 transcriptional regulator [Levilactobacillus koreensis]KRK86233.1 transcriptional regulator [Levilactobacillus koreensis JCM 16448]
MDNQIFEALFEIVTFFSRTEEDRKLLKEAHVKLDTPTLPIIMRVDHQPGISIGELADQIGRNHSSISRQVDKLIETGWLEETERRDKRVRRVILSPRGQQTVQQIKLAREAAIRRRLAKYSDADRGELLRVLQRLSAVLNGNDDYEE